MVVNVVSTVAADVGRKAMHNMRSKYFFIKSTAKVQINLQICNFCYNFAA